MEISSRFAGARASFIIHGVRHMPSIAKCVAGAIYAGQLSAAASGEDFFVKCEAGVRAAFGHDFFPGCQAMQTSRT